ncbi:hypothetical protein GCM10011415_21540 [Salipiger pallidus]|uniref:Uncharacterized protein n=1 Tax=Salipiger pallidus TaxID=1775170 RepID=A0A8J2ZK64_9RHOB|nr:hypothetical protein GCM10011415_21540 [Salipiger pallidus]
MRVTPGQRTVWGAVYCASMWRARPDVHARVRAWILRIWTAKTRQGALLPASRIHHVEAQARPATWARREVPQAGSSVRAASFNLPAQPANPVRRAGRISEAVG